MIKTQITSGGLLPFYCRNTQDHPYKRYGASSFANVKVDDEYTQRTITLGDATVIERTDGKFDAKIEVKKIGDSIHTLILKNASEFDYCEFIGVASFPIKGEITNYRERVPYWANIILAQASGWDINYKTIPLMLSLTSDPEKNHLPFIAAFGDPDNIVFQSFYLVVRGLETRCDAERLKLDADYVYFNTPTRIDLAHHAWDFPASRNIHDFHTVDMSGDIVDGYAEIEMRMTKDDDSWGTVDNVTGIIILPLHNEHIIEEVSMRINKSHEVCAWASDDAQIYWKKVGLQKPSSNADAILLPFSGNMWRCPDKAAFIDFSRIDSVSFVFKCTSAAHRLEVSLTALGHKTRELGERPSLFRTV